MLATLVWVFFFSCNRPGRLCSFFLFSFFSFPFIFSNLQALSFRAISIIIVLCSFVKLFFNVTFWHKVTLAEWAECYGIQARRGTLDWVSHLALSTQKNHPNNGHQVLFWVHFGIVLIIISGLCLGYFVLLCICCNASEANYWLLASIDVWVRFHQFAWGLTPLFPILSTLYINSY